MTQKEYPITIPAAIPISEAKDLDDFINETPSEAPKDNKIYGRKNGEWVEAADETLAIKVTNHEMFISPYSKSITLPLTHNLATGQILAMEGDMVVLKAQPGWGITRIDREEFGGLGLASGDTLLLPMAHMDEEGKPTDNLMLVGAVLFAAEEAVKGQSGEVLYTRRTSLFRATDNAIATWGGVKKWLAIADNESLLICHPLDITSATITRNGNDAANAAADLNQRRRIEEKLNLGGKDPRAWVGMADQLAPSEKTEQAAYRDEVLPSGRILGFAPELGPSGAGTRDGQIADEVSPVMREVSGVSGGSNQGVKDSSQWKDYGTAITKADDVITAKLTISTAEQNINIGNVVKGHKYLCGMTLKSSVNANIYNFALDGEYTNVSATSDWKRTTRLFTASKDSNVRVGLYYKASGYAVGTEVSFKDISLLDLTLLPQLPATFVASLGQSDAHRVAHALGFLALQRD